MAGRMFREFQALATGVKKLEARVNIGSSGAPTLVKNNVHSQGIESISRTATGAYSVTLDDKYVALCSASITLLEADATDLTFQVTADNSATTKKVNFMCKAGATPTDPPSGGALLLDLVLKNSSVN